MSKPVVKELQSFNVVHQYTKFQTPLLVLCILFTAQNWRQYDSWGHVVEGAFKRLVLSRSFFKQVVGFSHSQISDEKCAHLLGLVSEDPEYSVEHVS